MNNTIESQRSRRLSRHLRRMPLIVVPGLAGLVATVLFLIQGGFGGGHGNFDGLIVTLMLPSVYLVQIIPLPKWVLYFDLSYTVIAPTLMNTILVWLGYQIVRKFRGVGA
jgi:hypothetical protein